MPAELHGGQWHHDDDRTRGRYRVSRIKKLEKIGATSYFGRSAGRQLLSEWMNISATTATARDYVYAEGQLLGVIVKTDLQPK